MVIPNPFCRIPIKKKVCVQNQPHMNQVRRASANTKCVNDEMMSLVLCYSIKDIVLIRIILKHRRGLMID